MAGIRSVEPVLAIASLFSAFPAALEEARAALIARVGPALHELGPFPFTETEYYHPNMGKPLARRLVAFEPLVSMDALVDLKRWTNELEASFVGRLEFPAARPVNVDPGYVGPGKLVLASTKDHSHRLYLGAGIFGEVTLWWRNGRWETWPWTYPDYATDRFRTFFSEARARLMARLRG